MEATLASLPLRPQRLPLLVFSCISARGQTAQTEAHTSHAPLARRDSKITINKFLISYHTRTRNDAGGINKPMQLAERPRERPQRAVSSRDGVFPLGQRGHQTLRWPGHTSTRE
jgi:hypothetical protein